MKHYSQNSNLGFNASHAVMSTRMPMALIAWTFASKRRGVGFDGGVSN